MGRTRALALGVAASAALALCLLALFAAHPAGAAFPGNNGKIVFWSDRSAGPGLYTITPGGTATKVPGTSGGENHAAWSPDGTRIAFRSATNEIFVMNADGTGRRQLTNTPAAEQEPVWSPDGSRIAFAKDASGTDATTDLEIWAMNADGGSPTQLTNTVQGARDTQPAWSPLGNQIAFVSEGRPEQTNSDIYVMDTNPATEDASNLTDDTTTPVYQYNDEDPSWSPDGTQITYSTKIDVWKMNADGTGSKTNLTEGSGGGAQPAWSPDGSRIAYSRVDVTNGVNNQNIAVMDTNGANKTSIDTTLRKDEKPDWQPMPVCTNTVNANNDPLVGTAGKDVLCGDSRNNTINAAGGDDIVLAQGGSDKLTGALGNDTLNGGPGTDTALHSGTTAVRASLTTQFATGVGSDVLLEIENLSGSSVTDQFTGNGGRNVLSGLGGNDALDVRDGISGNDKVDGGTGASDTCGRDAGDTMLNCP